MPHRYLLFLPPLLALTSAGLAQTAPVITAADMPAAGDSLRLSQAAVVLPASAPPLAQAGANQTWNYAGLAPVSQRVQKFNSFASSASGLQLLYFGAGANKATLATPEPLPVPSGTTLPAQVADTQEFFNLTPYSFYSVGFGGTLNGVAVPVLYTRGYDIQYDFPTGYGSGLLSNSLVSFSLPGTGYFSRQRQRINRADGWGTVTTPFGTFQALRVVTSLADHDSVAVGASPGQGLSLPLVREYKWLATGQHVPVLTITTATVAGREVITGVEYRDIYRRLVPLAAAAPTPLAAFEAYPNPSAVGAALRLAGPAGGGPLRVAATDLLGRQLFARVLPVVAGEAVLGAEAFGDFRGVALLTVQTSQGTTTRRVVRE